MTDSLVERILKQGEEAFKFALDGNNLTVYSNFDGQESDITHCLESGLDDEHFNKRLVENHLRIMRTLITRSLIPEVIAELEKDPDIIATAKSIVKAESTIAMQQSINLQEVQEAAKKDLLKDKDLRNWAKAKLLKDPKIQNDAKIELKKTLETRPDIIQKAVKLASKRTDVQREAAEDLRNIDSFAEKVEEDLKIDPEFRKQVSDDLRKDEAFRNEVSEDLMQEESFRKIVAKKLISLKSFRDNVRNSLKTEGGFRRQTMNRLKKDEGFRKEAFTILWKQDQEFKNFLFENIRDEVKEGLFSRPEFEDFRQKLKDTLKTDPRYRKELIESIASEIVKNPIELTKYYDFLEVKLQAGETLRKSVEEKVKNEFITKHREDPSNKEAAIKELKNEVRESVYLEERNAWRQLMKNKQDPFYISQVELMKQEIKQQIKEQNERDNKSESQKEVRKRIRHNYANINTPIIQEERKQEIIHKYDIINKEKIEREHDERKFLLMKADEVLKQKELENEVRYKKIKEDAIYLDAVERETEVWHDSLKNKDRKSKKYYESKPNSYGKRERYLK